MSSEGSLYRTREPAWPIMLQMTTLMHRHNDPTPAVLKLMRRRTITMSPTLHMPRNRS